MCYTELLRMPSSGFFRSLGLGESASPSGVDAERARGQMSCVRHTNHVLQVFLKVGNAKALPVPGCGGAPHAPQPWAWQGLLGRNSCNVPGKGVAASGVDKLMCSYAFHN